MSISKLLFHLIKDEDYDAKEDSVKEKTRKRPFMDVSSSNDEMPEKYKHIRISERKVRPEVYMVLDELKSCYHMSDKQACAAVVVVANKLFGRNFKFSNDQEQIDCDTMPQPRCVRTAGDAITAMTLGEVAKEISESEQTSTIVYSDDGSRKQGAGSFVVQGITVNGKHRPLPTLGVDSETRQNLADLKVLTFEMLEKCSGIPAKDLFAKIDFIMTDQTSHNLKVEDLVCDKLDVEEQYRDKFHLFCNVHPSLMFLRKLSSFWADIENQICYYKIQANFLVDATNRKDSITEQMIDYCTKLINHDFDHKPWNYAVEFDLHIAPRKNMSVALKDKRFDRLTMCCATLLHHYHDLENFLSQMSHVTNQLSSIARSFQEIEFMPILLTIGALVGIQLINPFLHITMSPSTSYNELIPLFKEMYSNLKETNPESLLSTSEPGLSCFSQAVFQESLYTPEVMESLDYYVTKHKPYVLMLWKGLLPMLAEAFDQQKGHIFGFGKGESKPSQYRIDKLQDKDLTDVPIHNLAEERSVGFINYELKVRGAQQLKRASDTLVKKKSSDLLATSSLNFADYRLPAKELKEMRLKWNSRQEELAKERLSKKEMANISVERTKCQDLEVLKKAGGPFTTPSQVNSFLTSKVSEQDKSNRLYIEVRFAKNTSLLVPKSSPLFRLKKNHKNLSSAEYGANLKAFMNKFSSDKVASMEDFHYAIASFAE